MTEQTNKVNRTPLTIMAWLWVGIPLLYGLYELIIKVAQLFTG
ncbi:MFS transporter small subunit [Kibdelosporangium aridum]